MDNIQKVEYNNILVLTTQQIAEAYGTSTDTITRNFNRNKERYIKGKHYICLEGEELKKFKTNGQIDLSLKLNKLYLWTQKGAFLHAKSLNTDTAWEVYDKLVDNYFNNGTNPKETETTTQVSFNEVVQTLPVFADFLKVNDVSKLIMAEKLCESYNIPTSFLPDYVKGGDRETKPAKELLKLIGSNVSSIKFNQILLENGYLEQRKRTSKSSKSGFKFYKALTEKGLKYGENLISPNNPKETQPHYYVDTFEVLYNSLEV